MKVSPTYKEYIQYPVESTYNKWKQEVWRHGLVIKSAPVGTIFRYAYNSLLLSKHFCLVRM